MNQQLYKSIEEALKSASEISDCRLHLHIQEKASGYIWVSAVFAGLVTFVATAIAIIVGLALVPLVLTQICVFLCVLALFQFTDLRFRLAPQRVKEAFAANDLGRALTGINTLKSQDKQRGIKTKGDVLVLVSQFEAFSRVIPSRYVAAQVPESVWQAINNSLMIDVGHGEGLRGVKNSTTAISKLLKVYFPRTEMIGDENASQANNNRLVVVA